MYHCLSPKTLQGFLSICIDLAPSTGTQLEKQGVKKLATRGVDTLYMVQVYLLHL